MYTCDVEYLKKCSALAYELKLPVHIHYCENRSEIEGTKETYGMTPLEVLKQSNLINNKLILAHATFIDDESLEEFKGKDISFVHNPVSNLNLGCGIADMTKYKKYVNVALGTDSVGSGNNLNMFYHMSLVDLLQKGKYEDPTVFSSYDVLKMATINGAKALGMEDEIGSIEVGKKADIIMLDLNDVMTKPCPDLITNICHNALNNVSMTMINGEVLMQDKKILLDVDENELIAKAEERIKQLLKE
jgi:5-methylthioadenosine/S-adenosylhomocysteine deaminase